MKQEITDSLLRAELAFNDFKPKEAIDILKGLKEFIESSIQIEFKRLKSVKLDETNLNSYIKMCNNCIALVKHANLNNKLIRLGLFDEHVGNFSCVILTTKTKTKNKEHEKS